MKPKVFIDGSAGTTGLQIHNRLAGREDIELLCIPPSKRKDAGERRRLMDVADLVFLCLPDEAAREAVTLADGTGTRIIDASSAHRTAEGWVYGLPELSGAQRDDVRTAAKVSNPGCHATGAVLLLAPLVNIGFVPHWSEITISSLTGYTGGGKGMIEEYENTERTLNSELNAPRLYSLTACHKHIPEIMCYSGLTVTPAFLPVVADFPQGMQVVVALHLPGKRCAVYEALSERYMLCRNIEVTDSSPSAFAPSNLNAGTDRVTLRVLGCGDTIILTAQFDNLGKGAAGAAVQNMNLMLGFGEYEGLVL